ncbi:hypothetical protein RRG08_059540, partial [Elysia crispata]
TYQYLQHPICAVEQVCNGSKMVLDLRYAIVLITTYQYLQHPICAVEQCVTRWSVDLRYDGVDHCIPVT